MLILCLCCSFRLCPSGDHDPADLQAEACFEMPQIYPEVLTGDLSRTYLKMSV